MTPTIAANLKDVQARIATVAASAGRDIASIRLLAVSKTCDQEAVAAALTCGQTEFGENRVQEAAQKFPKLRNAFPQLRLHLIGNLQTNKVQEAVRHADVISTIDRVRLAEAIDAASQKVGKLPELLIQVNVGEESQKAGVARGEADALIEHCRGRFGDKLVGLLCIPPANQDPAPHFSWLARCAARHGLPELSMGMSSDFEDAIIQGSTEVRIGSAIFGSRTQIGRVP